MTKYPGQLVSIDNLPTFPGPFGPGYPVAFDETLDTKGFSEMRVWIWISVINQSTPVTANSTLEVIVWYVCLRVPPQFQFRTVMKLSR